MPHPRPQRALSPPTLKQKNRVAGLLLPFLPLPFPLAWGLLACCSFAGQELWIDEVTLEFRGSKFWGGLGGRGEEGEGCVWTEEDDVLRQRAQPAVL